MSRLFVVVFMALAACQGDSRSSAVPPQGDVSTEPLPAMTSDPAALPDAGRSADAYSLLGKAFESPEVQNFTGPGMNQCYVDSAAQIACPRLGTELALDGNDRVRQVATYPNAVGAFRPYSGPLPFGLDKSDTRTTVAAKLGSPDQRLPNTDLFTSRSPRLSITYFPDGSPNAGLMNKVAVFLVRQ